MLQSIRDRLTGPIVWFVVGLITIPFAFWGIESFRGGGGDPVVAKIGRNPFFPTKITESQFQRQFNQSLAQYQQLLGDRFRTENFNNAKFRQSILEGMVQESALREFAHAEGYRVGTAALIDALSNIPNFQADGKFSRDTYLEFLSQRNMPVDRYEAGVRESLVIDQMKGAVQDTAFVTPADAWEQFRLEGQLRKVSVANTVASTYADKVQVTDQQVASRYETDKSQYMSPERIKVAYVELDRDKIKPAEAPTPELLKTLYDAEKEARFSSPEERHVRHILVAFGTDKDAAKKKAEGILAAVKGGQDFAKEAEASSDDPGSKTKGGDLDWVRKGMMVPRFDEALFSMSKGEIKGPVETEFGWHILELEDIRAASIKPFEDPAVQSELTDVLRTREVEKKFQELSTKLEQVAFEKSAIEDVAKEIGVDVQKTDWFSRAGGEGIAKVDAVRTAAFLPELINDNENSKPVVVDDNRLVVMHKAEYEPSRQRPLEEVKDPVRAVLVKEAAAALAAKEAEAMAAQVREGKTLLEVAQGRGIPLRYEGSTKRTESSIEPKVLEAAFKLPRPNGKPEVQTVTLDSGDVAVLVLSSVEDPTRPPDGDDKFKERQEQVRDSVAGSEFSAYRKAVEQEMKARIVRQPEAEEAGGESPG